MESIDVRTAVLRTGLALPYAETGAPDGVPVVLVHAYVESWRYFEPVLRALPASVRAFAPTQRGHLTVTGEVTSFRVADFAADLIDFLGAAGISRAVLVGASSGGLVAQLAAVSAPERVAGLVLISSPVSLAGNPAAVAMRDELAALSDPIDRGFVEDFVRGTSPGAVPEEFLEVMVAESLAVPARAWREVFSGLIDAELQIALEDLRMPVLLLSGSADTIVHDDQRVLRERIRGAESIVYDGVGHGPHLACPEQVAADLAGFVARLT